MNTRSSSTIRSSEEGDVPISDENEKNTSRPVVLPDEYTGDEDWLDWLTHFELCAKINDWDDKSKTAFLAVRLKRSAQQVYRDLPEATTKSYDDLKEALTKRFDTTKYTERYKSEFKFIKRGKDEGLHELANRVRRLVSLAYPNIEAKFRDELARDQFLDALDSREFRLKVRQSRPKSLDEAVDIAAEIETMELAEERRRFKAVHATEFPSYKLEQQSTTSSNNLECLVKESFKIIEQNTAVMREMISALKVKEERGGYHGYDNNRKSRGNTGNACFHCGKVGHFIASCPEKKGNGSRLA